MDEYWATRTGRWRRALRSQHAPSMADRLYDVIHADIAAGALPAGALLPSAERVARELTIDAAAVDAAYARLLAEGQLDARDGGALAIASRDGNAHVGDATQIRFEAALLKRRARSRRARDEHARGDRSLQGDDGAQPPSTEHRRGVRSASVDSQYPIARVRTHVESLADADRHGRAAEQSCRSAGQRARRHRAADRSRSPRRRRAGLGTAA